MDNQIVESNSNLNDNLISQDTTDFRVLDRFDNEGNVDVGHLMGGEVSRIMRSLQENIAIHGIS
jgi:hypothetical protein